MSDAPIPKMGGAILCNEQARAIILNDDDAAIAVEIEILTQEDFVQRCPYRCHVGWIVTREQYDRQHHWRAAQLPIVGKTQP